MWAPHTPNFASGKSERSARTRILKPATVLARRSSLKAQNLERQSADPAICMHVYIL